MQDAQEVGRGIERAREEMTKGVGIEKEKGDGQREKRKKKLYVTSLILAANYGLRSLGLALTFSV